VLKTRIVRIGNSRGIRIPKALLEQTGLTGQVELLVQGGQLVIRPVSSTGTPESSVSRVEQPETYQAGAGAPDVLTSIRGIYRQGGVDLAEQPSAVPDETHVIVTFLEPGPIDLRERGIDATDAAELQSRLSTFAADWDSPEMSIYDHYDAAKAKL
jgi:antitoxin component of MazEF toxin-antitoxin module